MKPVLCSQEVKHPAASNLHVRRAAHCFSRANNPLSGFSECQSGGPCNLSRLHFQPRAQSGYVENRSNDSSIIRQQQASNASSAEQLLSSQPPNAASLPRPRRSSFASRNDQSSSSESNQQMNFREADPALGGQAASPSASAGWWDFAEERKHMYGRLIQHLKCPQRPLASSSTAPTDSLPDVADPTDSSAAASTASQVKQTPQARQKPARRLHHGAHRQISPANSQEGVDAALGWSVDGSQNDQQASIREQARRRVLGQTGPGR